MLLLSILLAQAPPAVPAPTAIIMGRVLTDQGSPVAGAMVMLTTAIFRDGQLSLAPLFSGPLETQTSSSGEYRLNAPPGWWYLLVSSPGFTSKYVRVVTKDGREAQVADIALFKPDAVTLSGSVMDAESRSPVSGVRVFATPSISGLLAFEATTDAQGQYRMPRVLPGEYRVHAMPPPGDTRFTATTIVLPEHDMKVDFVFRPKVTIGGYSDFDGVDATLLRGGRTMLGITANNVEHTSGSGTSFGFNGEFRLQNLIDSCKYYVSFKDLPEDWYVKSATYGSTDLLMDTMEATPNAAERIRLVFGNGARLHGHVREAAAKRVSVLLVDTDPRAIPRVRNRLVFVDASGDFVFRGVPPGTYRLFAVEQPMVGREQDPEFLREFDSKGTVVELSESGSAEVLLDLENSIILQLPPLIAPNDTVWPNV